MNEIEVCLTPELIHQYTLEGKIVVVVDILRATSCMVSGLAYGVESIYPVDNVAECFALGKKGMVTAGERGGEKVEGFDIGNSPYEYMNDEFEGKSIAVTTTNGTRTILASRGAEQILIGAFLNLRSLATYLSTSRKDVIIHCAGWKGMVNIEDTLFAGALIDELSSTYTDHGDPALLAKQLYSHNKMDLLKVAKESSHAKRLAGFGVEKDLEFCMQSSLFSIVPEFKEDRLVLVG